MQTGLSKAYEKESWVLGCLYLAPSRIDGQGIFTSKPLEKGTVVIRWGGEVFSEEDLRNGKARQHSYVGIGIGVYLANPSDKPLGLDDHMNYSCDGNIWMADEVTLETRRDLAAGEELTADYAIWLNKPDYEMKSVCNCGSQLCRKVVRGLDWKRRELQLRYEGHFSAFINDLIINEQTKWRINKH
jgi:hypothetical protein